MKEQSQEKTKQLKSISSSVHTRVMVNKSRRGMTVDEYLQFLMDTCKEEK